MKVQIKLHMIIHNKVNPANNVHDRFVIYAATVYKDSYWLNSQS